MAPTNSTQEVLQLASTFNFTQDGVISNVKSTYSVEGFLSYCTLKIPTSSNHFYVDLDEVSDIYGVSEKRYIQKINYEEY